MSQMCPRDPLSDYKLPKARFTCAVQLLYGRIPPSCLICPDGGGSEYTHQAEALPREELLKEDYNDLEHRSHPFTRIVCYPSPGGHHNERTLQRVSRSSLS